MWPFYVHDHHWKIVSTDFTPPSFEIKDDIELKGRVGETVFHHIFSGTTHVYSKCLSCGELKQQDFTGKFTPGAGIGTSI